MAQKYCKKDLRKEDEVAFINLANSGNCSVRNIFVTVKAWILNKLRQQLIVQLLCQ